MLVDTESEEDVVESTWILYCTSRARLVEVHERCSGRIDKYLLEYYEYRVDSHLKLIWLRSSSHDLRFRNGIYFKRSP